MALAAPDGSDRKVIAAEQPPWERCSQDGCTGVRLPATAWCLAHAAEQAPDAFDAELKRISAEGSVDARGVVISAELLGRLLAAVPRKGDRPTFTAARFDEASFQENAEFGGASFQGRAVFVGASFQGEAVFVGASFQGEAAFIGASFQVRAWFDGASFQGWARFERASFRWARFDGASFQGEAVFVGASFQGWAVFVRASFQERARFDGASFQRWAVFVRASFQDEAVFVGASFQGWARFEGSSFERATHIGPLLARQLVLDGTVFGARVQLDVSAAALCARRARFPAGVHLRVRYATVDLEDADLAAPAILAGVPSPFPGLERQEQQAARGWQRLLPGPSAQRWRPRLLSVRRADVAGLRLADVDLRACRFAGAHNLDRLRIEGAPLFARTAGWWRARRKTLAEEQHWRATRPGRWRPGGWYPRACQPPASPKAEELAEAPAVVEPARLAAVYRELRKGREDAKDEPGAADFYYGEMEMRRHDSTKPTAERFVLFLYWLLSGYALRASRALVWLVGVLAVATLLLAAQGLEQPAAGWSFPARLGTAVLVAVEGAVFRVSEQQLTYVGRLIQAVLRFAGPILLGLAVLSVRGRVKR